jgi:hypothetical protein
MSQMTPEEYKIRAQVVREKELIKREQKLAEDDARRLTNSVEEPRKAIIKSIALYDGNIVYEAISLKGRTVFLQYVKNPAADIMHWNTCEKFVFNDKEYYPEFSAAYEPYTFTKEEIEMLNVNDEHIKSLNSSEIHHKIRNMIKPFLFCTDELLTLLTIFTQESYEQHKILSLGYLYIMGEVESGKSRAGECILHLGYRPLMGIQLNSSNVYSYIGRETEGNCTIIDDEAQNLNDEKEKLTLYREGYRPGAKVPRILDASSSDRVQVFFNAYCSKLFLGYYMPYDNAFVSRCIPQTMVVGKPIKNSITPADLEEFMALKKELLLSRMKFYTEPLTQIEEKDELQNRTREIFYFKFQIIDKVLDAKTVLNKICKDFIEDKTVDLEESLGGYLAKALKYYYKTDVAQINIEFSLIWKKLQDELGERRIHVEEDGSTKDSANSQSFYSETLDRHISKKLVANVLRSSYGGRPSRIHANVRNYVFNPTVLKSAIDRYHPEN